MADEPDNLVLEHLRVIRAVVEETREEVRDLKRRVASIARRVAAFLGSGYLVAVAGQAVMEGFLDIRLAPGCAGSQRGPSPGSLKQGGRGRPSTLGTSPGQARGQAGSG